MVRYYMILGGLIPLCLTPVLAQTPPATPGSCVESRIAHIGTRLGDWDHPVAGSGSAVDFTNKMYQVSYDEIGAITRSKIGDPVRICLVSVPSACPPGDDRGREYRTTNRRTGETWTAGNSSHTCGGA